MYEDTPDTDKHSRARDRKLQKRRMSRRMRGNKVGIELLQQEIIKRGKDARRKPETS